MDNSYYYVTFDSEITALEAQYWLTKWGCQIQPDQPTKHAGKLTYFVHHKNYDELAAEVTPRSFAELAKAADLCDCEMP